MPDRFKLSTYQVPTTNGIGPTVNTRWLATCAGYVASGDDSGDAIRNLDIVLRRTGQDQVTIEDYGAWAKEEIAKIS
jgi:hypothetical protein